MLCCRVLVCLILGSLPLMAGAVTPPAAPDADTQAWLNRMSQALRATDYAGTFVYLHDGQLDTMHLVHRAGPDGERERLVTLSGTPREVVRTDDQVQCVLPSDKTVLVEKRAPTSAPFPARLPEEVGTLKAHYEFLDLGAGRIAGRQCKIVGIKPRDELRYGYRLWLDQATGLPLKSQLLNEQGEVVEQIMFTSLDFPDRIPDAALALQTDTSGFMWRKRQALAPRREPSAQIPAWQIKTLPAGFSLHSERVRRLEEGTGRHLVFSDGLAAVSVFIEPHSTDKAALAGLSRIGAVSAFGRSQDGYQITVVGEVPPATARLIGDQLQLQPLVAANPASSEP